jgi:hypothetical protein
VNSDPVFENIWSRKINVRDVLKQSFEHSPKLNEATLPAVLARRDADSTLIEARMGEYKAQSCDIS